MNKFCTYIYYELEDTYNFLRIKNLNILSNSSVFYICLFDIILPEDDLHKVEAYRSITELN